MPRETSTKTAHVGKLVIDTAEIAVAIKAGENVSRFLRNYYETDATLYRLQHRPNPANFYSEQLLSLLLHTLIRLQQVTAEQRRVELVFHNTDPAIRHTLTEMDAQKLRDQCHELRRLLEPISKEQDQKINDEFFGDFSERTGNYPVARRLHNQFENATRPPKHRPIKNLHKYVLILDAKRAAPKKSWRELHADLGVEYIPNSVRSQITKIRAVFLKFGINVPKEWTVEKLN